MSSASCLPAYKIETNKQSLGGMGILGTNWCLNVPCCTPGSHTLSGVSSIQYRCCVSRVMAVASGCSQSLTASSFPPCESSSPDGHRSPEGRQQKLRLGSAGFCYGPQNPHSADAEGSVILGSSVRSGSLRFPMLSRKMSPYPSQEHYLSPPAKKLTLFLWGGGSGGGILIILKVF